MRRSCRSMAPAARLRTARHADARRIWTLNDKFVAAAGS
jgi:hypothetical protein